MKILIPLTILVLSFIIYYFFSTSQKMMPKDNLTLDTKKLNTIEPTKNSEHNYIPSLATIRTTAKEKSHVSQKSLTLEDLRAISSTQKSPSQATREYLTLEDLRKKVHSQKMSK